jgi:hypothetical protein
MSDRVDLAALLADPARAADVPLDDIAELYRNVATQIGLLDGVKSMLAARIAVARDRTPSQGLRAPKEWLSTREAAELFGCSTKTILRRTHDGTWQEGTHWQRGRGGLRLRRSAVEKSRPLPEQSAPRVGLAYGPDVPPGRRRRLTSLRNEVTVQRHGATAGAEADGTAARVPGTDAAHGAARSD